MSIPCSPFSDFFFSGSHPGARPLCAPYQGRIYSTDGSSGTAHDGSGKALAYVPLESTSYGEKAGLFGINCGHLPYPFIDGTSYMRYEPTADAEENARLYKESQQQRYMERKVRKAKTEADALDAAGDADGAKEMRRRARSWNRELKDWCAENGRDYYPERVRVVRENATEQLKNPPESGIIKGVSERTFYRMLDTDGNEKYRYLQTDAIQKLDSPEAIAKYFEYTDKWGETCSPITEEFSKLKLDVQKEAAEGIAWAQKYLMLDTLPNEITTAIFKDGTFGEYSETYGVIRFSKTLTKEQAFATAVHEMTHYADHVNGEMAVNVVSQVLREKKVRRGSLAHEKLISSYSGVKWKDDHETLAYSAEAYAKNRGTSFTDRVFKIWLERKNGNGKK